MDSKYLTLEVRDNVQELPLREDGRAFNPWFIQLYTKSHGVATRQPRICKGIRPLLINRDGNDVNGYRYLQVVVNCIIYSKEKIENGNRNQNQSLSAVRSITDIWTCRVVTAWGKWSKNALRSEEWACGDKPLSHTIPLLLEIETGGPPGPNQTRRSGRTSCCRAIGRVIYLAGPWDRYKKNKGSQRSMGFNALPCWISGTAAEVIDLNFRESGVNKLRVRIP